MDYNGFFKIKREELNYSTRALSKKIDISASYISMIENDKLNNPPSDDVLEKLSKALKLSDDEIDYLYKLVDEKILPTRTQAKIKNMEQEIKFLKLELQGCRDQLNIQNNNNNGHIIVGNGNNIKNTYGSTELSKELNSLDDKQKEKVLKFINEYIK